MIGLPAEERALEAAAEALAAWRESAPMDELLGKHKDGNAARVAVAAYLDSLASGGSGEARWESYGWRCRCDQVHKPKVERCSHCGSERPERGSGEVPGLRTAEGSTVPEFMAREAAGEAPGERAERDFQIAVENFERVVLERNEARAALAAERATGEAPAGLTERCERFEQTLCHIANLNEQAAGTPAQTLRHAQDVARGVIRSDRAALRGPVGGEAGDNGTN